MDIRETAHFININNIVSNEIHNRCLNSFMKLHPTFKINVWNERSVNALLNEANLLIYFNKLSSFINKYNLVKYLVLGKFGGWYVDLDIEWKKSLYELIRDRKISKYPQLFIPVRSFPNQGHINHRMNDDMLIYAEKDIFLELVEYCLQRKNYDEKLPYEPFGPVSLSMWLHQTEYKREYLYEWEIQKDGIYCNHLEKKSWKIYKT